MNSTPFLFHRIPKRLAGFCLGLFALSVASSFQAAATPQPAPGADPIQQFAPGNHSGGRKLDHSHWAAILDAVVVRNDSTGRRQIDYGRLNKSGSDLLDRYVRVLQKIRVNSLNNREQLAYWLNFYNAASLRFVFDEFKRMHGISGEFSSRNPWTGKKLKVERFYLGKNNPWTERLFEVEGIALSLNDIEHRILYALWGNPLVMYGLSCPARGCPTLQPDPFVADAVEAQLKLAAREFASRKDSVELKGGQLEVSSLYVWHGGLFGGETGVIAHLRETASPDTSAALAGVAEIHDDDFNWRLNGKAPPKSWNMPQGTFRRESPPRSLNR